MHEINIKYSQSKVTHKTNKITYNKITLSAVPPLASRGTQQPQRNIKALTTELYENTRILVPLHFRLFDHICFAFSINKMF